MFMEVASKNQNCILIIKGCLCLFARPKGRQTCWNLWATGRHTRIQHLSAKGMLKTQLQAGIRGCSCSDLNRKSAAEMLN